MFCVWMINIGTDFGTQVTHLYSWVRSTGVLLVTPTLRVRMRLRIVYFPSSRIISVALLLFRLHVLYFLSGLFSMDYEICHEELCMLYYFLMGLSIGCSSFI